MKGIAAKTALIVASRLGTRAAQLVSFIVLARVLAAAGFGSYGVMTSAVFLAGLIGNLGLRQATARAVGRQEMDGGEAASTVLIVWPVLSLGSCWVVHYVNRDQIAALSVEGAIAIYVAVAAVMLLTLLQGVFLGRGDTKWFALSDSGPRVLQSCLILLLWALRLLTLDSALISFAAGFLLFIPLTLRRIYVATYSWRPITGKLIKLLSSGFLFALSLFLITLQGRVGVFFLSDAKGLEEAGQFFAAQRAGEIFLDVATAAALVLFSETARSNDAQSAIAAAARTALSLFIAFTLIGGVIALASPILVGVLLGQAYRGSVGALAIIGVGLGPLAAARIMNSVVSGMGRPWLSAIIAAAGLVINMAVCALTVPLWGVNGTALGLVSAQTVCCIAYVVVCRILGLRLTAILPDIGDLRERARSKFARIPLRRAR